MSLRFLDSFDHYTTPVQKWTSVSGVSPTIGAGGARTGVAGLTRGNNQFVSLTLNAQGTWIIGFAWRIPPWVDFAGPTFVETYDGASVQGDVSFNSDGRISLRRGGVSVATSVKNLMANVFYYIEFKHIIDNVAGLLEVRVDGEVWATFVGDTQATANPTADIIGVCQNAGYGGAHVNTNFDDLYILDGVDQSIADPNSPPNNNYWGNTQIECLVPTAPGNYAEWTTLVGAPTHWQAEDEVPPDEDTSYVESATLDQRDTYNLGNLAVVSATIPGIQVLTRARMTAAGVANIARLYRRAGVDNQGADVVLQTSYNYQREIMGGDPIAAGAWVVAAINAMEMGAVVR